MTPSLPVEFVETLFDAMGDVVFCIKDRESRYQAVNQAFVERVNVVDKDAMIGRRANDFFPAALAETYNQQDQIVIRDQRPLQDQLERITHYSGQAGWFLASKFPILDADGTVVGLVGISQDLHTPCDADLELANLRSTVDYIKANLDQPMRVETLAQRVAMSQVQLDRRMKRVFRLSTKKFIMKCRLEEATRRLTETNDSLAEIAAACGFSDQSAFTRQFRAAENIPPLMYRKRHVSR